MPERDADSPAREADDVSRAVRRFVRSTLARPSSASPVDAETWMDMFTVALAGVRRACVDALDAGVDEMTIAAREAGTFLARRERASERELAASTRALTTARREIERLNERLGREMIRRGAEAEEEEEGGRTDASAAAEATLYREACRKYRRRAEHYEALYRKMTTGGGTTTTRGTGSGRTRDRSRGGGAGGGGTAAAATRGADGDQGDAATRRRRLEIFRDDDADERRGRETLVRCALREGKEAPPARRRRVDIVEARDGFRRAERREGARDDGAEYEDALWGAARRRKRRNDDENDGDGGDARARRWSAQGDSERPRERENVAAAANETAPRRRAGEALPLDRIFLDSKNAPSSSPSRERGTNAVRKNKRLSDNAPRSPNAVFDDDAENARRRPTKYQEVVRKKSERELLNAYVCQDCQTFYDAMMPGKDRSTIKCTHAPPRENVIENSRHRAKWAPEPAPKGFWNLAFTPEK